MKKFKILSIIGSFVIGIPTLMVILILFTSVRNCNRHELEGLYKTPKQINTPDTIIVEKIVEKIKVDTFYIKVPQPQAQVKVEPPKDTL
jgi:hypothetical protein